MNGIDERILMSICNLLGDTDNGLTGREIIDRCNRYAWYYGIKIPISKVEDIKPNKRTALYNNLLVFSDENKMEIIKELCRLDQFKNDKEVQELYRKIRSLYGYLLETSKIVIETRHWLEKYPEALKHYESGLNKYQNGIFERNALDDMRLALEILVRNLLNNNKSLENQNLGKILKENSVSQEFRNMFRTIIDYYIKFQNNHVKHNENINKNEIEGVIDLTTAIMKMLLKNIK